MITTNGRAPIGGFTLYKRQLDTLLPPDMEPWCLHDLRRTVATGLQRLDIRLEVTEAVLNHVSGSRGGIAGVYQRHTWSAEKRTALETWGQQVIALAQPNVTALRAVHGTRLYD